MSKNKIHELIQKAIPACVKVMPVIVAAALNMNSNGTGSVANGQPEAPQDLKKYRLF